MILTDYEVLNKSQIPDETKCVPLQDVEMIVSETETYKSMIEIMIELDPSVTKIMESDKFTDMLIESGEKAND